jgi:hypothetical protein
MDKVLLLLLVFLCSRVLLEPTIWRRERGKIRCRVCECW